MAVPDTDGRGSNDLVGVIMAGGVGSRFWPLSRADRPKQFLKLFGDRSLLQGCYDRIASLIPPERILVITNDSFMSLVRDQLPAIPIENVIGEPVRRDTAAAVSLASFLCQKRFGNPVMVILPADHMIDPAETFQKTLLSAARAARRQAHLYTIGITPTYPAIGYGYLECGQPAMDDDGIQHFELLRFKEKPDLETATSYLNHGSYLWNSGIFVWTVETILKEINNHLPEHQRHLRPLAQVDRSGAWPENLRRSFHSLPSISIDYGLMEKASNIRVVASEFSWSDLGGWLALEAFLEKDGQGNSHRGRIEALDAGSNLVFSEDNDEIISLIGVQNLIVIRVDKHTLIVHRDRAEEIKKLFDLING